MQTATCVGVAADIKEPQQQKILRTGLFLDIVELTADLGMAFVVARSLVLTQFFLLIRCQEKPEHWPGSYNVGPYKHVYPPTNISIDQFSCKPDLSLNKTCPLFIQLIMSFGGSYVSSGVVPGIQIALDHINAFPDILPGYTLHYTLQDSDVCSGL